MSPTKQLVRGLLRELRSSGSGGGGGGAADMYRAYVLETARRFQVTGEEHCRARDELSHLGVTYLSYLSSRRRHQQLLAAYRGRGDRSVQETAGLVGFKLPHDPR